MNQEEYDRTVLEHAEIIERLKKRIEELNPSTKTFMEDITEYQHHIFAELQKILGEEK